MSKITIPKQLQDPYFRFILLKPNGKEPLETNWQDKNNYDFRNKKLLEHISKGGNYGVVGGYGNLVIIDSDSQEVTAIAEKLKATFLIKTGSPEKYKKHFYFISDKEIKPIRLSKEKVGDLGDVRAEGQYVVGPNCMHPTGGIYKIEGGDIAKIKEEELKEAFKDLVIRQSVGSKDDFAPDTRKQHTPYVDGCLMLDLCHEDKQKKGTSRNYELFKHLAYIGYHRGVENKYMLEICRKQYPSNSGGAIRGWLKYAKEGSIEKSDCPKMQEYLKKYNPELIKKLCSKCKVNNNIIKDIKPCDDDLELLKNPELLNIIDGELDKKIEGEKKARITTFMTFNMRNVENLNKATDNLMLNDVGGTGKDHVAYAVYSILPDNEKVMKVRITPKVLVYLNDLETNPEGWIKKCLYLEDVSNTVLNDDAYKVMSSADTNSITSTSIVINNKLKNIDIKGKPSIIITTASASPKFELLRRYPIGNLTSSIEQTKAILQKQAKFAKLGISPEYDPKIKKALAHLKRVKVRIPFADLIANRFPSGNVIIRTHFPRFLDYIKSSCALHQYQREIDEEEYYLATEQDFNIARDMMAFTTSNQLMIPLTKKQKMILEEFEKIEKIPYTFQELEKILQKIAADRWLRSQLDKLVEYGFLTRSNEKRENINKPLAVYSYNEINKLELPKFKELSSNKTYTTNTTNTTNSANTEYLKYLKYLSSEFELQKAIKKELFTILTKNNKVSVQNFVDKIANVGVKEKAVELVIQDGLKKGEWYESKPGFIKKL